MKEALKKHLKKKIVVDTSSSWVYIGQLDKVLESCLVLSDVDVHDSKAAHSTKEHRETSRMMSAQEGKRPREPA